MDATTGLLPCNAIHTRLMLLPTCVRMPNPARPRVVFAAEPPALLKYSPTCWQENKWRQGWGRGSVPMQAYSNPSHTCVLTCRCQDRLNFGQLDAVAAAWRDTSGFTDVLDACTTQWQVTSLRGVGRQGLRSGLLTNLIWHQRLQLRLVTDHTQVVHNRGLNQGRQRWVRAGTASCALTQCIKHTIGCPAHGLD